MLKLADAKVRAQSAFEERKSESAPAGFYASKKAVAVAEKSSQKTVTVNGKVVSLDHEHNWRGRYIYKGWQYELTRQREQVGTNPHSVNLEKVSKIRAGY